MINVIMVKWKHDIGERVGVGQVFKDAILKGEMENLKRKEIVLG